MAKMVSPLTTIQDGTPMKWSVVSGNSIVSTTGRDDIGREPEVEIFSFLQGGIEWPIVSDCIVERGSVTTVFFSRLPEQDRRRASPPTIIAFVIALRFIIFSNSAKILIFTKVVQNK